MRFYTAMIIVVHSTCFLEWIDIIVKLEQRQDVELLLPWWDVDIYDGRSQHFSWHQWVKWRDSYYTSIITTITNRITNITKSSNLCCRILKKVNQYPLILGFVLDVVNLNCVPQFWIPWSIAAQIFWQAPVCDWIAPRALHLVVGIPRHRSPYPHTVR